MAGIPLSTNFDVGAALPLDSRDNITFAEMLTINENTWPEDKLVICSDDHKVYLFSKSNESDPTTGKFREFKPGTEITVDDEMSLVSENPVQNKVICIALNGKVGIEDTMPTPTLDSTNLVTSGGVYNFDYRAKDTSISSDWLGPNNISSDWETFTSVSDFARILGKRRSVYINFSLGQVQTAIANGILPSTITSGPGGMLHIVTGNSDNGGRGFAFFWCDNTGEVLTATAGDWTSSNWVWRIPGYGTLTGTATPNTSIVSSSVSPVIEWVRSGDMIIVNLRKISFTTNATAAKTLATGLPECGLKRFEGVICGASGHCDIYIDPNTTELKIQYGASGSYGPQMAGQIVYIAKS